MRKARITRGEDFQKIVRRGYRLGGQFVVTHVIHSADAVTSKYGFIVSKRVGNAVQRNLVRRRLNGISHEIPETLDTGLSIIIRAKPEALHANYLELSKEVLQQITKLKDRVAR